MRSTDDKILNCIVIIIGGAIVVALGPIGMFLAGAAVLYGAIFDKK